MRTMLACLVASAALIAGAAQAGEVAGTVDAAIGRSCPNPHVSCMASAWSQSMEVAATRDAQRQCDADVTRLGEWSTECYCDNGAEMHIILIGRFACAE